VSPSPQVFNVGGSWLRRVGDGQPAGARTQLLHDQLRASVLSSAYPCVLGASVLRARNYAFAHYPSLGDRHAAGQLAGDLEWFAQTYPVPRTPSEPFTTFISLFDGPAPADEPDFERLLWQHLDLVHEQDRQRWQWDPTVSADPEDPFFSFSVAAHAYFVVGMHPKASRASRLAPVPALVFNRHEQFEILRARGQMARMSRIIRARDERLDGRSFSALAQYGEISEARQYAGHEVDAGWKCPFSPGPTGSAGT
jgi:FPC/CPF motif-containing protein YcgG